MGKGPGEDTSKFLETLKVGNLSSASSEYGLGFLGSNLDLRQVL